MLTPDLQKELDDLRRVASPTGDQLMRMGELSMLEGMRSAPGEPDQDSPQDVQMEPDTPGEERVAGTEPHEEPSADSPVDNSVAAGRVEPGFYAFKCVKCGNSVVKYRTILINGTIKVQQNGALPIDPNDAPPQRGRKPFCKTCRVNVAVCL